jgi:uncharacterized radical SAM superfamily protein
MLLTGGADREGNLPWERFAPAIKTIRQQSALHLSAHVGFPDDRTCLILKQAGLHQALVDVMGDDATARDIYHLNGIQVVCHALDNLGRRGLETVPHVVAGLRWGRIHGELEALEIIRRYSPAALVIVVLSPLKGTPMAHVFPPSPLEVGRLIARARLLMPETPIALGCERPRDRQGLLLERLAIRAGATRMAVWSEEAVREAVNLGLTPRFQPTCCSLGPLT